MVVQPDYHSHGSPNHSNPLLRRGAPTTEKTAGIINGMMRMRLVDEIILYLLPVIAGNGSRLFQGSLPESEWTCTESKRWKDNIIRITYGRKTPRQPVVVFKK